MRELDVIESPAAAALVLDPIKSRILSELSEPASAAAVAQRVGLPRQKVSYHLRGLEEEQLVEAADERRWGGITERLLVASARSYVVSPVALGPIAADPERSGDRMSASYLIALAARIVREVGALWRTACKSDKRLATLSIDTVVRFKSPADRAAFTNQLTSAITDLVARYHDDKAPRGRSHRVVIASYPAPEQSSP
jgi:DNA-binding transcriptional ArsR family regulator